MRRAENSFLSSCARRAVRGGGGGVERVLTGLLGGRHPAAVRAETGAAAGSGGWVTCAICGGQKNRKQSISYSAYLIESFSARCAHRPPAPRTIAGPQPCLPRRPPREVSGVWCVLYSDGAYPNRLLDWITPRCRVPSAPPPGERRRPLRLRRCPPPQWRRWPPRTRGATPRPPLRR